jgi:hypothetical protein
MFARLSPLLVVTLLTRCCATSHGQSQASNDHGTSWADATIPTLPVRATPLKLIDMCLFNSVARGSCLSHVEGGTWPCKVQFVQAHHHDWPRPRAHHVPAHLFGLLLEGSGSAGDSWAATSAVRVHPSLLPLTLRDYIGFAVVCVTLLIAAGGGVGGGGLLVPSYILCLQFTTEDAVALSNVTIAGGAMANLTCNLFRCFSCATSCSHDQRHQ